MGFVQWLHWAKSCGHIGLLVATAPSHPARNCYRFIGVVLAISLTIPIVCLFAGNRQCWCSDLSIVGHKALCWTWMWSMDLGLIWFFREFQSVGTCVWHKGQQCLLSWWFVCKRGRLLSWCNHGLWWWGWNRICLRGVSQLWGPMQWFQMVVHLV